MIDRCRARLVDACKWLARPVGWISIYAGIVLSSIGHTYMYFWRELTDRNEPSHYDDTSCWWPIAKLILAYAFIRIGWGLLRRRNVSGIYARKRIGGVLILIGLILVSIRAGVYIASRRVPLDHVQTIKSWEDLAATDRWWDSTANEVRDHYKSRWIFERGETAVEQNFKRLTQGLFKRVTQERERETRSDVQQTYGGIELIGIVWLLVGLGLRYIVDEPCTSINEFLETKRFLDAGNDPNGKNGQKRLHMACLYGDVAVAALLIDSGADVNMSTSLLPNSLRHMALGGTPLLHTASEHDNVDIVDLLIESGADVNLTSEGGETPLHWAARRGNEAVVKSLLRGGADISARNNGGKTPYDLVSKNEKTEVAKILRKPTDEDV